jgi:hypothetical protein
MDMQTKRLLEQVNSKYQLPGQMCDYSQCDNGHINDTYRVNFITEDGSIQEYIFQRINGYVFKDPAAVMHNIHLVSQHVQTKRTAGDCDIISFLPNVDGTNYTNIDGDIWRICHFVENSVTFDFVEDSRVLYSAGYAFGRFQAMLSDLPMDSLYDTIPDFHNTKKRLDDFFASVSEDPLGRVSDLGREIEFFANNRELAASLYIMAENGELPLRVTHNDTKYNNILMHKDTLDPLCVIDLDTVMPGLSMFDFGDAIRFAANTAPEDETDLNRVGLNMLHFREFTKGFMLASKNALTQLEIDNMALGAIAITIELASRFLADHIRGDKYFRIHHPNHNLERAKCQIRLAEDMLKRYDEMSLVVRESAQ